MELNQYSIVLINLDPTVGSETKKIRPCVTVSPNEMNRHLQTITIAPMTTKSRKYLTRVRISHHKKTGLVVIDQIRTIDRKRVFKVLGRLSDKAVAECKDVIRQALVDLKNINAFYRTNRKFLRPISLLNLYQSNE